MQIIAPKVREAVNNAIRQDRQPASITAELQALQEEYAQDAIGLMPPDQFEALVSRLPGTCRLAKLHQPSGEPPARE